MLTEAVYTAVPALPRALPSEHNLHISHLRAARRGPAGETGKISPEINWTSRHTSEIINIYSSTVTLTNFSSQNKTHKLGFDDANFVIL